MGGLIPQRRIKEADEQYEVLGNQYRSLKGEFGRKEAAYTTLQKKSVTHAKELKKKIVKMEHKASHAREVTAKVQAQNKNITKKITQLFELKQAEIIGLEAELELRESQNVIATTSADQIGVLKSTVTRLDAILSEEASYNDKQLTMLEEKLLKHEPPEGLNDQPVYEDDLTKIVGIGPKFAEALNGHGVKSYKQLAQMSEAEITKIGKTLGDFGDRVIRDGWIEQAKELDKYRH